LRAFLVMYLMSLKLWTLGAAMGPLMANVAIQVFITALIGVLLLFRWLGRDYDAAVTVGGFLGFGLSSMPVAMATMDSVALRYGPSPKAFSAHHAGGIVFRRPGKRIHRESIPRASLVSLIMLYDVGERVIRQLGLDEHGSRHEHRTGGRK
jgi:hypothetical protein